MEIDSHHGFALNHTTRRALLLSAAAAVCAAAFALPRLSATDAPAPPVTAGPALSPDTAPTPITRVWPMLGTVLQISAWDADTTRAAAAMASAYAAMQRADSLLSANRETSEIAQINRRAGTGAPTTVSPWTAAVLDSAITFARASAGPESGAAAWTRLSLEPTTRTARLADRAAKLDVTALAKGFALDRAYDALRAAGVASAIVDLGGDFRVIGRAPVGPRWNVALRNPFSPADVFAAVQVESGAVATWGMLPPGIDNEGGAVSVPEPQRHGEEHEVASVYVLAPSGVRAAALAEPLYRMGPAAGCRFIVRYPGVDAVWVRAADDEEDDDEPRDADDGVEPHLVVITDTLADRIELLSEEPTEERAVRCSELLARPAAPAPARHR